MPPFHPPIHRPPPLIFRLTPAFVAVHWLAGFLEACRRGHVPILPLPSFPFHNMACVAIYHRARAAKSPSKAVSVPLHSCDFPPGACVKTRRFGPALVTKFRPEDGIYQVKVACACREFQVERSAMHHVSCIRSGCKEATTIEIAIAGGHHSFCQVRANARRECLSGGNDLHARARDGRLGRTRVART